jgi:hypothetical protein
MQTFPFLNTFLAQGILLELKVFCLALEKKNKLYIV